MKTLSLGIKTVGILALACILLFGSCKKDDKDNTPKLSAEQIEDYVSISNKISSQMQTSAMNYMSKAFENGFTGDLPDFGSKKSGKEVVTTNTNDWRGPDAQGWYYWTGDVYGTKYTEKVRSRNDTIEHIHLLEYNGADAQTKFEVYTKHIRYIKNKKEYFKGFTKVEDYSSGYSNISRTSWKMTFEDYDPTTGAGVFDWYWGVSQNSGGNTVSMHRFLHIEAVPTTNNWLHVRVIIYDDRGVKVWDFEYDTPFEPVDLEY